MRSRSVVVTGICGFLGLVYVGPAVAFPRLESDLAAASARVPSFSDAAGVSVRWNGLAAELLVPPDLPAARVSRIAEDLAAIDGARSVTVSVLPVRPSSPPRPRTDVLVPAGPEAGDGDEDAAGVRPARVDQPPDLRAAQLALEAAVSGSAWRGTVDSNEEALTRLVGVIDTLDPRIVVDLVGHTDAAGEATANLVRSQQEAAILLQSLVAHGVDSSRLTAFGQGEAQPLVAAGAPDASTLNHRIEMVPRAAKGNG